MNKRELRTAIRLRNGIPDNGDPMAGHTDIDASIAAALLDLSAEKRWPWLLTSAALTFSTTTGLAPLPATYTQPRTLVIGGLPARNVTLEEYLTQTTPFVWADVGASIGLYPIPTSVPTATLWYYQIEPALETDTATPLLPAAFHQTLIARASYHLNMRRNGGDAKRIQMDLAEYQAGVKNVMQTAQRATGSRQIRSAFRERPTASWS